MSITSALDMMSLVRGSALAEEPGLDININALTIPGYLREVVQRYAAREAVVMCSSSGERIAWSYDELWQRSIASAKALLSVGVGKGSRVALLLSNRPEFISTLFGIALAGGIAAPLSTFSTPSELEYLLRASAASILLYERRVLKSDFGAMLCEIEPQLRAATRGLLEAAGLPFLRHLVALEPVTPGAPPAPDAAAVEDYLEFLERGKNVATALIEARAMQVKPHDQGGLFFSSGTTSLPKGILHAQRAFAIQWWRWPRVLSIKEPARSWTGNGFFWSANVSMILGTAFSSGGAAILQPTFDAEAALQLLAAERVSLMSGRPHQWTRLQAVPSWASTDLSSVRYVTRGELVRQHPTIHSTWERPNSFGTTETMTILSAFTADTPVETRAGSFGAPLPGNTLKIVEPVNGQIVPRRQRGEICIKGPTLMLGYCDKTPEETFDEEGFYHTGDGGYVDEQGRLYWQGRLSFMIKTGGANVSPEEVDAAIATLPGVKRSQTVGVPHETLSEMVVACIVPIAGVTLKEDEVVAQLKKLLASFKVPRKVLFFDEAELTLTGSEKIKVDGLRQLAAKRLDVAYADTPQSKGPWGA